MKSGHPYRPSDHAEVAREHGLPAYLIFHDTHVAAIAECCPVTLRDLG